MRHSAGGEPSKGMTARFLSCPVVSPFRQRHSIPIDCALGWRHDERKQDEDQHYARHQRIDGASGYLHEDTGGC